MFILMITFSARGKKFSCNKQIISTKWKDSLLKNLVVSNYNNIELIDDSIIVDINPNCTEIILDYLEYACTMSSPNYLDIRELTYIGLLENNIETWKLIPLYENEQSCDSNLTIPNIVNIYTRDNKVIILNKDIINNWPICKFKEIICGFHKEYLYKNNGNNLDIMINLNYEICNILISIMRDNINCYLDLLLDNKYLISILEYYGIINRDSIIIFQKRYERVKNLPEGVIIQFDKLTFFSETNRKTNEFVESKHQFDWCNQKESNMAPFKVIKDVQFNILWDQISKTVKYEKKEGYCGRDYYRDEYWKYNINNNDMNLIEHFYYRYLIGYID